MQHSRLFSLFLIFLALLLGSLTAAAISPPVAQRTAKPKLTDPSPGTAAQLPLRPPHRPQADAQPTA